MITDKTLQQKKSYKQYYTQKKKNDGILEYTQNFHSLHTQSHTSKASTQVGRRRRRRRRRRKTKADGRRELPKKEIYIYGCDNDE